MKCMKRYLSHRFTFPRRTQYDMIIFKKMGNNVHRED